jgi:hypothetical protein
MGLDMYLARRVHLANYAHDPEGQALAAAVMRALGIDDTAWYADSSISVELPAGYWRKANAIHQWFVVNVQGGEDECREHYVNTERLQELRETCQQVLDNPALAEDLLPTQNGFFFGTTDYDEWYTQNLRKTIEICDHALDPKNSVGSYDTFHYRSSW